MMRLRVHHLLCSALYVGEGYSDAFCENMQKVVQQLWEEPGTGQPEKACDGDENGGRRKQGEAESGLHEGKERKVELTAGPDIICSACPNLGEKGCKLDDNHVVSKDEALAQTLGLKTERTYLVSELLRIVGNSLTAELFEDSCHNCEWYAQGLCHYDKLMEKYRNRLEELTAREL